MNYIQGTVREEAVLFNECLDNIIEEENPVRVIPIAKSKFRFNT